jgi:hypothetical protein
MIVDGETGYLVPQRTAALAMRQRSSARRERRLRFGNAALRANSMFTWDRAGKTMHGSSRD